jgi:hypothetical protein
MQNPSDLATRATRKTTRFGVRDAKYNAAGAMHRVAWALQNSKAIGQICEKPWENQGFAAERTGTELFNVLPMVLKGSKGNEDSWSPKKKYDAPSSLSGSSQPCFMLLSGVHHTKNKNLKLSNVVEDDEWKSGNRPVP